MHLLKRRSTRFYLGFLLILALTIGGSAIAAFADTPVAQVAVSGGNLSMTGLTNAQGTPITVQANPVTLNGDDASSQYSLPIGVTDARGNGAGWNLTIATTAFQNVTNNVTTTANITSSITAEPVVACTSNHNNCTPPTDSVVYNPPPPGTPLVLTLNSSAQKFYGATANTGLGKFSVTPTVNLAIPANTLALTYSATVTVAINTGP